MAILPKCDPTSLHLDVSGEISALAEKFVPAAADYLLLEDSADADAKKKVLIANLPNGNGGFADYNDLATATVPINLVADTWTALPNDGLGAFTNKNYLPFGVTELMDVASGKIDPSELRLGDFLLIRSDYTVIPSINNASLEFRYTLGTGGASYTLEGRSTRLDRGSGTPYRFALGVDMIYMGDLNTRDNHIGMEVKLSTSGTVTVAGSALSVVRYTA